MTKILVHSGWERLIGPDATRGENLGTLVSALGGTVLAVRSLRARRPDLGPRPQLAVAALALDLLGGVWANGTQTTKRWYHRPGQRAAHHLAFTAAHLHPFVLAALDRGRPRSARLGRALTLYALAVAGTAAVRAAPPDLRLPVALVAALAGLTAARTTGADEGVEWLLPAYYLKLLPGHAVEPAPPGSG